MTRGEAIAFLKDMNECTYGNLEAVEMAIKALEQEPCKEQEIYEKAYKEGYDKGWSDGNFIGANRWIPISERLPEDKQSVLVWCPQYKNIYCAYLEKEQWWIFGAFAQEVQNEVVAWMPLPDRYKE